MYIRVKVLAGAKREVFRGIGPQRFEIHVKEPAERNMANMRVMELVAKAYGLSPKAVKIISGNHHPVKLLRLLAPPNRDMVK